MIFIFGLGNPGGEYENTRHNLGFAALDLLASKLDVSFAAQAKFKAEIARSDDLMLVKPQTYMNLSGESAQKVINFYDKSLLGSTELNTVYVVHDDLDIKFGQTKLVYASGPKAHNGVNSMREKLGTSNFWYGRLGVDNRDEFNTLPPDKYVLAKFSAEDLPTTNQMLATLVDKLYVAITSTVIA